MDYNSITVGLMDLVEEAFRPMHSFFRWTILFGFVCLLSFDLIGTGVAISEPGRPAKAFVSTSPMVVDALPFVQSLPSGQTDARGIDAKAIARAVATQNPELSTPERRRIGAAVMRYSGKYNLDPALVTAVLLVESGSRPWVVSPKGAVGLMQVMPHMFEALPIAGNLTSIESNVEAGCWILADNIRRLGLEDGVSAYFWGSNIRGVAYRNRVFARRAALEQRAVPTTSF